MLDELNNDGAEEVQADDAAVEEEKTEVEGGEATEAAE